jgi:DNA-directed RNA polymerase subunit M/transcription elongation factor TFIIS
MRILDLPHAEGDDEAQPQQGDRRGVVHFLRGKRPHVAENSEMASAEPSQEFIRLVCPGCSARLHPRVHLAGKKVACPDCGRHLRVPQPSPAPTQPAKKARDPGAYHVASDAGARPLPATFLVLCPLCSARLHPRVEHVGRKVKCPDCDRPFVVPPPKVVPAPPPKPEPGAYGVGEARAQGPALLTNFLTVETRLEPEKISPPPAVWWASGVFDFPWRGETRPRWIWLVVDGVFCAAISIFSLLVLRAVLGAVGLGGPAVMLVAGIFGALLMLPWLLTGFYAAALLLAVVIDTANGADEIDQWPIADVSDWFWRGCYFLISFTAAGAVGSITGIFVGAAIEDPEWTFVARVALLAGSLHFLFPLLILSALEANSAFAILTPTMCGRFASHLPSCLLFYGLSAMLGIFLLGPLAIGAYFMPTVTLFFVGPLAGTWVLIYARLLGRLAWRMAED